MFKLPTRIDALLLFLLLVHSHGQLFLAGGRGKAILELYKADRTTLIGPLVNKLVIDLANASSINIKASAKCLQTLRISSVSFFVDGKLVRTDNNAPYWMIGDTNGAWTPAVGRHTIYAKAYRRNDAKGRLMLRTLTNVIVIDSRTKSPVAAAAPVKAPVAAVPTIAPVTVPSFAPNKVPSFAPNKVPMLATIPMATILPVPTRTPVATAVPLAPTKTPLRAATTMAPKSSSSKPPTRSPTKIPTRVPTKRPTRLPTTRTPTEAPIIPCNVNTIAYLNCITRSNKTLRLNGTAAEDKALQWLVVNDTLALTPNSESNKTRLRQRFALLTFGFQPLSDGKLVFQGYKWDLSVLDECKWGLPRVSCTRGQVSFITVDRVNGTIPPDLSWLTALQYVSYSGGFLYGTLPSQLGQLTQLSYFSIYDNYVQGTIPSSIGAWSSMANFDVAGNKLSGIVPTTVSAWNALVYAYFYSNKLNGTMPLFGGGFCPSQTNVSFLKADCDNSTGKAKISCACCSSCY
jgi:hypothetical protein